MRTAPSADRNKEPIAAILGKYPPFAGSRQGSCLEIASGTGQHVAHFAAEFPHVTFQPTEYEGGSAGPEEPAYGNLSPVFASIIAWTSGVSNVLKPVALNAATPAWPVEAPGVAYDAIYACNICHIAPYAVTTGLLAGAGRLLATDGGRLFVYGPFMVDGQHTAESNAAFDTRLRSQNADWGVRDATEIAALAASHGLRLVERAEMPANNFVLVLERVSGRA